MNPANLNETAKAILASALISLVLACVVVGNPFRAFADAYSDYSATP